MEQQTRIRYREQSPQASRDGDPPIEPGAHQATAGRHHGALQGPSTGGWFGRSRSGAE